MTHTKQMDDSEGEFQQWNETAIHCRYCDSPHVQYRVWESSCGGYEDYQYKCPECQRVWWVDGIDS